MQEYLSRTHLGEKMDRMGGTLLILLGSLLFFALLWGVRISTLVAGCALGAMLLILRDRTRRQRLHHREKALRQRIGGEMRLEEWRLMPARRVHAEAAMLLSQMYPLTPEKVTDSGAMCRHTDGEMTMVFCARMHPEEKLCARDIAAYQRDCLQAGASRGIEIGRASCRERVYWPV